MLLVSVFIGIMFVTSKYDKYNMLDWFRNPAAAYEYEMRVSGGEDGERGRWGGLRHSFELVTKDPGHFFLGYGPCSSRESFLGPAFEGKLYRSGVTQTSMASSQRIVVETGFAGVVMYLSLFAVILKRSKRDFTNHNLLLSMLAVFFIGSFYCETFFADVLAFMFWFMVSALHKKNNIGENVI